MGLYSNAYSVIRQYLSGAVGDLVTGTFASGTTTTGVHTMLRKSDDYYNEHGYRVYIYGGTNIGEEREVSDWVYSSSTLTVAPAFTSAIDATSQYELRHLFWEDEYRNAINLAIASIAGKYLIDKTDITVTLTAGIYEYSLPSGMNYVNRITTEADVGGGVFNTEGVIDTRDWQLISPRKLKLHEERYSITANKDLRIEGQGRQTAVSGDADIIYLPPDWLGQKAITFLPQAKIQTYGLDATYQQALVQSVFEPRNSPASDARRVIE